MKKYILLFVIVSFSASIFAGFQFLNSSPNEKISSTQFTIEKGQNIERIANNLKRKGFIRSELFFLALIRLSGNARTVKSGQYNLHSGMRSTEILQKFVRGVVATIKFTIPEGFIIRQIADLLEKEGVVSAEEFIAATENSRILEKYKIPFNNAEGFLFPDTYIVAKDLSAEQIVDFMIERFFSNLRNISSREYEIEEMKKMVIIASLVEKEAQLESERPVISAVFYNRLEKGKRLESCATIQYILGKTKERLLYSDLRIDSPYNTYLNGGLPPGPISNPGLGSLKAAIEPADVDYLFFVSKRDGSHFFSATYEEHLEAIRRYNPSGKVGHQIS
jgi:UPF0755 protein